MSRLSTIHRMALSTVLATVAFTTTTNAFADAQGSAAATTEGEPGSTSSTSASPEARDEESAREAAPAHDEQTNDEAARFNLPIAPVPVVPAAVATPTLPLPSAELASQPTDSAAPSAVASGEASRERLRVGVLAGVGFPRPFAVEAFAKIDRVAGVGVEYSFLPRTTVLGAETTFKAFAVDGRVFPFRNAFFIGVRGGRQWLDAQTTVTGARVGSSVEAMSAATWFVNPRIGFLHTMKSGITVGVDAGVQIPINPTFARSGRLADSGLSSDVDATLTTVASTLGNKTTPSIDLLRVGFLF